MHDVFLQNAKTSDYACNIIPIDSTYILRSVTAVSWEFRFLLDIKIIQTPTTLDQGDSGMYEYIRHVWNNSQFGTSILHILAKERRTAHRDRWNKNRSCPKFKFGDAVEAHVQVQSKSDTGEVAKLGYMAWVTFHIKNVLGKISYEFQSNNDPTSGISK